MPTKPVSWDLRIFANKYHHKNRVYKVQSEVLRVNLRTKVKILLTAHITVIALKGQFLYVHHSQLEQTIFAHVLQPRRLL